MSRLRGQVVRGVSWSVVGQLGRQLVVFGVGVVLARLLSPREFGLVAMVTVISGFANVLVDLGLGAALVNRQDARPIHYSSVFWANLAGGTGVALLLSACAPLIAAFYGEPALRWLVVGISATFVFTSLGAVQRTIYSKGLDFKTLARVELTAVTLSGGSAVAAAYAGWGVWALVLNLVLTAALTTAGLWLTSRWRPGWRFEWAALRELFGFSANLLGEQAMNYWVRSADNLLIGRFIGSAGLGLYSRAYAVMLLPLQNISNVVGRVLFPSLSTIQGDPARVRRIFLSMTRAIGLITFPLMTGLLATARPFVLTVFGAPWVGMVPVLQVLCMVGLMQSIVTLVGPLFLSQPGGARRQFRIGLFVKPMLIAAIVAGLPFGIVGVAASYAAGATVAQYVNLRAAGAMVGLRYREIAANLSGVLACALLMGGGVWGLGEVLPAGWPVGLVLLAQVAAGAALYLGLVHVFRVQAYREVRDLLLGRLARRQPQPGASADPVLDPLPPDPAPSEKSGESAPPGPSGLPPNLS